jgi:4-hydroxy-4-methyl-2-oxoglutarate aldolase
MVGGPLEVGGLRVESGEWLVADADGVVVIGADDVDGALANAEAKAEREVEWFTRLADGATTAELFGLSTESIEHH